jgi:hypothetical protein
VLLSGKRGARSKTLIIFFPLFLSQDLFVRGLSLDVVMMQKKTFMLSRTKTLSLSLSLCKRNAFKQREEDRGGTLARRREMQCVKARAFFLVFTGKRGRVFSCLFRVFLSIFTKSCEKKVEKKKRKKEGFAYFIRVSFANGSSATLQNERYLLVFR